MSNEDIQRNIKDHGWHFLFVFDPKGEHQDYSYTIGLEESFGHPEIMIFGLKKDSAHAILADIVEDIRADIFMESNKKLRNVIGGEFEVMFKAVNISAYEEYLGAAARYYGKPFKALIMLWPDKANVLPTEKGHGLTIQDEALALI